MARAILMILGLTLAYGSVAGCVAVAAGAAGAVVVDEAMERRDGDDGLF